MHHAFISCPVTMTNGQEDEDDGYPLRNKPSEIQGIAIQA